MDEAQLAQVESLCETLYTGQPSTNCYKITREYSSDNDVGPNLPAGVLRKRGGWEDTLGFEIQHQREKLREGSDEKVSAAVDLSQFRNEEVGKGYQAKHVVRQKGAENAFTGVVDKSGGIFSKNEREGGSSSKKRNRDDDGEEEGDRKRPPDTPLQSYLKCKGMRDFVKEVDKITATKII